MRAYKVIFENNTAVSAIPSDFFVTKNVNIERGDGKASLEWLIIFANDEQEAIINAKKLVKDYFGFLKLS